MHIRSFFAAAMLVAAMPASATILTFDTDVTRATENILIDQNYGDRVTAVAQGGALYGVGPEGFTANVVASYGPTTANITRWSDGYGDLTNVLENEDDGDTLLSLTLTADQGFAVTLFDFDMAGYFRTDYIIPGLRIVDGTGQTLFSASNFLVQGALDGTAHSTLNFGSGLTANSLSILVDLTGLGGNSDNIGIDNVRFGQGAPAVTGPVPEPATWAMMILGFGLAGSAMRRRSAATVLA